MSGGSLVIGSDENSSVVIIGEAALHHIQPRPERLGRRRIDAHHLCLLDNAPLDK